MRPGDFVRSKFSTMAGVVLAIDDAGFAMCALEDAGTATFHMKTTDLVVEIKGTDEMARALDAAARCSHDGPMRLVQLLRGGVSLRQAIINLGAQMLEDPDA
jgi:hypothetical protein